MSPSGCCDAIWLTVVRSNHLNEAVSSAARAASLTALMYPMYIVHVG